MNTTAAAAQAHVTVATIRTWCRRGVVAATKRAGRWVIDAASLAHRIAIGALKTRKETPVTDLDLTATYTVTYPGDRTETVITPTVKTRTRPTGATITRITGLAPLLADHIDAITDEGNRLHTLTVLEGAQIVLSDQASDEDSQPAIAGVRFLDRGQVRVQYHGTPDLPVEVVIDLAHRLRAQLAA